MVMKRPMVAFLTLWLPKTLSRAKDWAAMSFSLE